MKTEEKLELTWSKIDEALSLSKAFLTHAGKFERESFKRHLGFKTEIDKEEKFEITLSELEAILKSSWEKTIKKYRLEE